MAATLGQDAQVVVESAMHGKCGLPVKASPGRAGCISDSAQLLEASEDAFQKTEATYLATLVRSYAVLQNLTASACSQAHHHVMSMRQLSVMIASLPVNPVAAQ